ncbi:MAG: hypothetical protein RIQ60_2298 [Pseudomonadota bacterium]
MQQQSSQYSDSETISAHAVVGGGKNAQHPFSRPYSLMPWLLMLGGLLALYGPTFWDLAHTIWASDNQGHGPIVLGIALWLIYRQWPQIQAMPVRYTQTPLAYACILTAGSFYAFGRSQGILLFEVGSFIFMLGACALLLKGWSAVRQIWFALFFLLFIIPLPGPFVDAMTQPMKLAVSAVAESVMNSIGLPVARTGVTLQVGQYQMLVADACAGLHTLFTLEALGLLYLNLIRHSSALRNIGLGILIVPISFIANVLRVIILCLITYFWGDEAGQGFLHGFAGMVLFMSALMLIISTDSLLRLSSHVDARSSTTAKA